MRTRDTYSDDNVCAVVLKDDIAYFSTSVGCVHVYDIKQDAITKSIEIDPNVALCKLALSFDGNQILLGGSNGECFIVSLFAGTVTHRWSAHDKHSRATYVGWVGLARVITATSNGSISVWNIGTIVNKIASYKKKSKRCFFISACFVGDTLIAGGSHGQLLVLNTCKNEFKLLRPHGKQRVPALLTHGSTLFTGGHDGIVLQWKINKDETINLVQEHTVGIIRGVEKIYRAQDGGIIIAGFKGSELHISDLANGTLLHSVDVGGWKRPLSVSIDPDVPLCSFAVIFRIKKTFRFASSFRCGDFSTYAIGDTFHGRTTWMVRWLSDRYLCTCGEDGTVKLLSFDGTCLRVTCTLSGTLNSAQSIDAAPASTPGSMVIAAAGPGIFNEMLEGFNKEGPGDAMVAWACERKPSLGKRDAAEALERDTQRTLSIKVVAADRGHLIFRSDTSGGVEVLRIENGKIDVVTAMNSQGVNIRCIDVVQYNEWHIAFLGCTDGIIRVVRFNGSDCFEDACVKAHHGGINIISARISSCFVTVCTCGDDEAISCGLFSVSGNTNLVSGGLFTNAANAALRSVWMVASHHLYAVGCDRKLRVFSVKRDVSSRKTESYHVHSIAPNGCGHSGGFHLNLVQVIDVTISDANSVHVNGKNAAVAGTGIKIIAL